MSCLSTSTIGTSKSSRLSSLQTIIYYSIKHTEWGKAVVLLQLLGDYIIKKQGWVRDEDSQGNFKQINECSCSCTVSGSRTGTVS